MMRKKKILVVIPSFSIGGTVIALHSWLSLLDTTKFEVDIFSLYRGGVYLDKMPNCRILPENVFLSSKLVEGTWWQKIVVQIFRVLQKFARLSNLHFITKWIQSWGATRIGSGAYDAVICYAESIADSVCYYPAKKRITWIHCDYSRYLKLVNGRDERAVYSRFDKIVCVSQYTRNVFAECMPTCAEKAVAIHNVINTELICQKASEKVDLDARFRTDCFVIVSAGRLDPVKQFDKIPRIASEIKRQTNKPFVWYIIGGARGFEEYERNIVENIKKLNLTDSVVLLGEKRNVYPYMAQADLYVSTSESEAFPLVVQEAKALSVPVVLNTFGSAQESVQNGVDGFVVPLSDMADCIVELMQEEKRLPIQEYLTKHQYNNDKIYKQIEDVL